MRIRIYLNKTRASYKDNVLVNVCMAILVNTGYFEIFQIAQSLKIDNNQTDTIGTNSYWR